ncbi:hypothetical protein [Neptuniibacter halophilus]|nr:hypothetical protein [Neptuniibacter halophilus]
MLDLVDLFIARGWDTSYIAYTCTLITAVVLVAAYRYLSTDDAEDR